MQRLTNKMLFCQNCLINGEWIQAATNKTLPIHNPYDGHQLGTVPDCDALETRHAIQAANNAWPAWRNLTATQRSDILNKWSQLIEQNKEDLATIMTLEQGKPITESRSEIDYANSFIKWFAEEAKRVYGDIIPPTTPNQHILVLKQPLGVVGAITPWNFPAAMITRKCAPALAAGCTVVLKPASETPFTALALGYLATEAGFPPGVLNIITGSAEKIGGELTSNSLVRKISFTGSTKVGKLLMQQCASTLKKLSLELGGNAPFIVFDDGNLTAAVKGTITSKFRNTGQTCVCANRILVQDKIYDEYCHILINEIKKLKLGNGLEPDVQQGPLINDKAIKKVESHIADALSKGAKILLGGKRASAEKLFFEPTVIVDAKENMLLAKEETFGPVAPIFRFHTEEEAIEIANNTEFGLASYFYSDNVQRIFRVAESLEYGMVGINTGLVSTAVAPFGGIKESGMGREGSKYGLDEYVEIKYLCLGM